MSSSTKQPGLQFLISPEDANGLYYLLKSFGTSERERDRRPDFYALKLKLLEELPNTTETTETVEGRKFWVEFMANTGISAGRYGCTIFITGITGTVLDATRLYILTAPQKLIKPLTANPVKVTVMENSAAPDRIKTSWVYQGLCVCESEIFWGAFPDVWKCFPKDDNVKAKIAFDPRLFAKCLNSHKDFVGSDRGPRTIMEIRGPKDPIVLSIQDKKRELVSLVMPCSMGK